MVTKWFGDVRIRYQTPYADIWKGYMGLMY